MMGRKVEEWNSIDYSTFVDHPTRIILLFVVVAASVFLFD